MPPPSSPHFLFFLLIFTFASFHYLTPCSGSDGISCPETEKQALLSFKYSMNNPGGLMSSWEPQADCCMWEHVVCSNLTGHVLELHLHNPGGFWDPSMNGALGDSLINLTHLRYLDLSWNRFKGAIPAFIGSFSNLEHLDLGDNGFSGTLDDSLLNLTHLRYLDLSGNHFEGAIPAFIGSFPRLEHLDLSYAESHGTIPPTLGNLSSLSTLILSGVYYMALEADSFEWMTGLSHLEHLELNRVNLSRATDWLQVLNTLPSLAELTLSETTIPYSFVPVNEASRNNLTLKVGTSWVPTFRVSTLELQSWNLGGGAEIPMWLNVQRGHLMQLDLSNTGIAHQFASWFWEIQNLNLSHNQLRGGIPDSISHFDEYSHSTIYLGNNLFNGSLPRIGREVNTLDLSNNNLSGEIPEQLTRLVELRFLNLSGNHLGGIIPHGIGDMKELESLDLSRNSLTGDIPETLAVLTSLNYLNVSYNNLSGRIPQSTQIMGFPPSGFIGNQLCGHPLPSNCNDDGVTSTTRSQGYDEDGKSEVEWLYVFSALGYAVGLAAVCNALIFKKEWRYAFFGSVDNIWNKIYVYASIKVSRRG